MVLNQINDFQKILHQFDKIAEVEKLEKMSTL